MGRWLQVSGILGREYWEGHLSPKSAGLASPQQDDLNLDHINAPRPRDTISTVESILLYECESWTLTETMERKLNGTYTRMLRTAQNIHWSSHTTNDELYNKLPKVSDKIASRRLGLAGHCFRHKELSAQPLVLWEPKHGHRGRGCPRASYIDTLKRDTGAENTTELASMMAERKLWRGRVVSRLSPTK